MVCCGAFDALDRKVELIRGELTQMNPAGPMHDDLIVYLTNWSLRSIDPAVTLVASQTGLDLPEQSSRPEPDLMWVRKARYRARHPRASDVQLAVEVAESSLSRDLEIKRRLYAEAGIMEYWIVDAGSRCVHVHRDPEEGEYRERAVLSGNDLLTPNCRQEAVLSLKELFEGE
jgi:Uma2 family endonuclease